MGPDRSSYIGLWTQQYPNQHIPIFERPVRRFFFGFCLIFFLCEAARVEMNEPLTNCNWKNPARPSIQHENKPVGYCCIVLKVMDSRSKLKLKLRKPFFFPKMCLYKGEYNSSNSVNDKKN